MALRCDYSEISPAQSVAEVGGKYLLMPYCVAARAEGNCTVEANLKNVT